MESKKLKHIVLELVHGDIAAVEAGAIVNAANNGLWMGVGVAGAIKSLGGIEIEKEAMAKGPISIGTAVATTAGKLKARYVIHAAVMGEDLYTNAGYIAMATQSSLVLADSLGIDSVALPALGTGVGRFPIKECANIMMNAVLNFDRRYPKQLKKVVFVLFSEKAFREFETEYRKVI
ncbi:MAG: macro domain-containing protein [Spirochaetia bacterium]|nr:macro domain-containing protein [Spirochaetia bacterium]